MAYHTFLTILIPCFASFAITFIATKFFMSYFYSSGIVEEDHNKAKLVKLPGSGGIAVTFGALLGILTYVFGTNFVFYSPVSTQSLLAIGLSELLIAMVGFLDDIHVKSRMVTATDLQSFKKGLKQWQKPLLTIFGALPLMAINAGVTVVHIPLVGAVDFGLLYPLLILPLAIIFVSNALNLLGGFDGLQPGMYIVASAGFLIYSVLIGTYLGALLSAILLSSLLGFLPFNLYKAKVIPGDSFTYVVGASFVAIMVMGSAEAFGVIVLLPWIIEFLLHLRRGFNVSDLGIRQKDGTFKAPYGKKIYSWTHLIMNLKKAKESEIALYLSIIEIAFVALAFLIKIYGLL